ncbi:MAG: serine/threonine-protein kinase [Planctomycetota bacterium]
MANDTDRVEAARQQSADPQASAPIDFEQTLAHEHLSPTGVDGHNPALTKQCNDLAFAISILQSGFTSLQSLSEATKSWTTYGNSSLAEHLLKSEYITDQQLSAAAHRTRQRLEALDNSLSSAGHNSAPASQSDRERDWLSTLDPGGKVAKLLGIADTSVLTSDQIRDRQVGSRYTLLRKLGQGGLGTVWLARDQNLQRYVAVKEISGRVAPDDPALEHFRREAEITGRLEHPGIVPVYQYGEDTDTGRSFYVMRFLGKKTLQDAISEYHERRKAGNDDPMVLHRLLSALVNVCHSVGHAHSLKVIHRDLKPENIALDEFGQVTLLDWGLAKINDASGMYEVNGRTEPGDLHSVGSTQVGRVLGTPLYMAPEQAAGRLDEVDELTDVYALGGILYAILTGSAPHQSVIEQADSGSNRSDMMSRIVTGGFDEPISLNRSISPELNAVCMKALANKRYLRYSSAATFSEDIQRCMAGSPVTAYTPPTRHRAKQWMAAHPTLTQAILLCTSLLLIGGAAIAYTARQGSVALQAARYSSIRDFARELDANLHFESQGLARDLHFVSELPLMDAIVLSQQSLSESTNSTDGESLRSAGSPSESLEEDIASHDSFSHLDIKSISSLSEVAPREWLDRQGNVFDGLLKANPAYLVAVTCMLQNDKSIEELIRSERSMTDRQVRRVPQKQLIVCPAKDPGTKEAQMLETIRPDDVILITNDQLSEDIPVRVRSPLVLSGVRAVFDQEGDLFGLNIIELDLRKRLEEICRAVAPDNVSIYITDFQGNVGLEFKDGRVLGGEDKSILEKLPSLAPFFAVDSPLDEFGDDKTLFAKRVRFDGKEGRAQVGIVALFDRQH